MEDCVLYERKGKIACITLNRPEAMNAFNGALFDELAAAWLRFRQDGEAWVAILNATGERAFSVGVDVKWAAEDPTAKDFSKMGSRIEALNPLTHQVWKPVIAAIGGFCLGIAWPLVQWCDLRVAAEDAHFGTPEVRLNMLPEFTASLRAHLPPAQALELLMVGDRINARRAHEIGFLNRVVSRQDLMATATELAQKIAENGPVAVRKTKELFYRSARLNEDEIAALVKHMSTELKDMEDRTEAVSAFLERRKPVWRER